MQACRKKHLAAEIWHIAQTKLAGGFLGAQAELCVLMWYRKVTYFMKKNRISVYFLNLMRKIESCFSYSVPHFLSVP